MQCSQQAQPPRDTFSRQQGFLASKWAAVILTQAGAICRPFPPEDTLGIEVSGRCPRGGVEVPGLAIVPLRAAHTYRALLLPFQPLVAACLQSHSTKCAAQCNVCKYDQPLQYYSFSFGKPFRQEMITDPCYVNDGNAEISIWVNSCIFQP